MVPRVLQDVEQRATNLARRAECPCVVAIAEHGARAVPVLVERPRQAHRKSLHPARERTPITGLGDEVEVRGLNRVVHQPPAEAIRALRERALDHCPRRRVAQARQTGSHARRDVHRMSRRESGTSSVGHTRASALGLAPGARSRAAAGAERELVLASSDRVASHGERCVLQLHDSGKRAGLQVNSESVGSGGRLAFAPFD